jgi:hypothetical protein
MKQLFGGLLLGIGILVMTVSGLCTLAVVIGGLSDGGTMVAQDPTVLFIPLVAGGVPLAVGFGLYFWGRALLRQPAGASPERPPPQP